MNKTFGKSAFLAHMHSPAPSEAVTQEVAKLLAILGEHDPSVASELARIPVNLSVLGDLRMWNGRLAPHPARNRIGKAGTLFFATQALVTTVMRSTVLDLSSVYPTGVARAMARGADGLFEVGSSQFDALSRLARDIVAWLVERKAKSVALIESPIGNTLPVQHLCDLAQERGLPVSTIQWNAPRNDRSSQGRTIKDAADACISDAAAFDYVVLIDESHTGSRLIKFYDALLPRIGKHRFLPVAMLFGGPSKKNGQPRQRLINRLDAQGRRIGFAQLAREFPTLRIFKMDAGPSCKWESTVIWNGSDIIAGKRKVNLIFTILDHCMDILNDLASDPSEYRPFLELAWSQNTSGEAYAFSPRLIQDLFKGIVTELPLTKLRRRLWKLAKERFPNDYVGDIDAVDEADPKERWTWLRTTFLEEAGKCIEAHNAGTAWNAIDTVFAASFPEKKPQPRKDVDAASYSLPFNETVRAFNLRLRQQLMALTPNTTAAPVW